MNTRFLILYLFLISLEKSRQIVDSLFPSIPLGGTINFILDEICGRKKLEPFCKKSVFKKLLTKLCKGCTFLADGRLIRQVDGCPMSGRIPVVRLNSKLYKRYVDDIYSKRIKNYPNKISREIK